MDYWYDEEYNVEPEPTFVLPEGAGKININLRLNSGEIEAAIDDHVHKILQDKIKRIVNTKVNERMKTLLGEKGWGQDNFKDILQDVIEKRLLKRYPEIVEDKTNEFEEHIKNLKFKEHRNGIVSTIQLKSVKKVDDYIENELIDSVKKSKEYIEQFSQNYFAKNLFRAMGMMDKMMPTTENILKEK